tara:strand:- start:888 stop:2261 length:1374 start_codon:yes stop_codon:yes gene_type:complete
MTKALNYFKSKRIIIILLILIFSAFTGIWNIVSGGYDKQNKIILFVKKIIPNTVSRKVRDVVFIIPDLKERNDFLSTQVNKHEQGLEGQLFNEEIILSKKNKKEYLLKEFFLPFPRLDTRLGWASTKNSQRAHHFAFVGKEVIVISGEGKTIYFEKNNILKGKLNQKEIANNIDNILKKSNSELIGIRDLFAEDNKIFISLISKNSKGLTINAYSADINLKKIEFETFFETKEYWKQYNVFSGGRFSSYKNNMILFTTGFSNKDKVSQQLDSLLGKIIAIDKKTKAHKIISMGHRNPQGLSYIKKSNIIFNTEHGPKGGDEINVNFQKDGEISNFGWDVASYGVPYTDPINPYKTSHAEYGFVEPLKYYVPSIGISQMVYMPKNLNYEKGEYLYVSSLRAGSIYVIKVDKNFNKIIDEDRIFFKSKRIRDIMYDKENNVFFLIFEFTPSIGILKLNK